jgi:predicted nucleotidyltransferase
MVPGLGTRMVDRSGDERPVLAVPGRPAPTVGGVAGNDLSHAPKRVDAINLETGRLETVALSRLMAEHGDSYPHADQILSMCEDGEVRPLDPARPDSMPLPLAATFDGLIARSSFALELRRLLRTLEETVGLPVEIEFASDGEHFYLLQCRPLAFARAPRSVPIPRDVSGKRILFSTHGRVSSGWIPKISHIVYVDRAGYAALEDPADRDGVRRAIRRLNEILPKKQYVLIAPSLWRSSVQGTGGTEVRCRDLRNAALLVDLFETRDAEKPAPSPRNGFLEDVVESGVAYLPVFPHGEGGSLNEHLLRGAHNHLGELVPDYASLAGALRVIDIPKAKDGKLLQILMNGDLDEAVAVLTDPEEQIEDPGREELTEAENPENYWRWRHRVAEQIASQLDPGRLGVVGAYLFGSTKNGTAGPASDIDMLIHFRGTDAQCANLTLWLEGWSLCLDEINYLRTGYRSGGLLDVHIVTDEDIRRGTSYAVKIGAVTDAARPLKIKSTSDRGEAAHETDEPSAGEGADRCPATLSS